MSDALSTLRTALAPRRGLKPIPLARESHVLASAPASTTRLLNMYAEKLPPDARSPFYLKPTPGTVLSKTLGAGPVYAKAAIAGALFAISGGYAWFMLDDGSAPVNLGAVGTPGAAYAASIAIGATGVVFCVPPNAYVTNFTGTTLHQITTGGGDWPAAGVSSVCYQDGYYIFSSYDGTYFFTSDLLDATSYTGLTYVYITSTVDFILRCIAFNGELWLFCVNSIQVWADTGNPAAPFQPRKGGVIGVGLGAPRTVVENLDESLFWLGIDGVMYRSRGYAAERVSHHALERLLPEFNTGYYRTAVACGFVMEGHPCVAISLPELNKTFVLDAALKVFHERCSDAGGNGRWTINTACLLGARVLLGSSVNGGLYHMLASVATENTVAVPRVAVLPSIVTHGSRGFMSQLEVEMEVGTTAVTGSVAVDWSDDGGITWSAARTLSTGALGATRTRVKTTRPGSFRQRSIRLTSATPMTIYGVDVDISVPVAGT